MHFEPRARLHVVPALAEEARPVVYSEDEHARVNEVEFLVVDPVLLYIVDDEAAVRRHEGRLDG